MSREEERNRRIHKESTALAFMRKGATKTRKNRLYKSDHCCNFDHCSGVEFLHHLKTTV